MEQTNMQIETPVSQNVTKFEHITQIKDRLDDVIAVCYDPKIADALVEALNNPNKSEEDSQEELFAQLFS
jgi:hypothetical protein